MARLPDKSSRFILISVFLFCTSLLYLDIRFNAFKPIHDFYNSSTIFLELFSRETIFSPISNSFSGILKAKSIKEQNKQLRDELNNQLIQNFVILNANIKETDILLSEAYKNSKGLEFVPAKIASFDVNKYLCCDKHRIFLKSELADDIDSFKVVINHEGIVGQTIKLNKNLFEVILLSDINHKIPIKNENNFYCEAGGFGMPKKIFCDVDLTLIEKKFELNQKFYSSGMGGVFPRDIEIGIVSEIKTTSTRKLRIIIDLNADPLISNFFGVLL